MSAQGQSHIFKKCFKNSLSRLQKKKKIRKIVIKANYKYNSSNKE